MRRAAGCAQGVRRAGRREGRAQGRGLRTLNSAETESLLCRRVMHLRCRLRALAG